MSSQEHKEALLNAAKELNIHFNRNNGERVTVGLDAGLDFLSNLLYLRLHSDVEKNIGTDSMTVPVSETKTREQINTEMSRQIVNKRRKMLQVRKSVVDIRMVSR